MTPGKSTTVPLRIDLLWHGGLAESHGSGAWRKGLMESDGTEETVTGHVKWFDPTKGFGFVVPESGGPDILLHANVLRGFGQSSVAEGSRIEQIVQATPRGLQAVEILAIDLPEDCGSTLAGFDPDTPDASLPQAHFEPARVKWFDSVKGFGFANVFGRSEDVFVHVEVLRRSGMADLTPGEAVALKVVQGSRGSMAAQVAAWDSALKAGS